MGSLFEIIYHGILIGIFISAPMGPIGMLVIQRTLNKGRSAAFYTGVGAALSDIIYCLLTGLGLSFVIDFIVDKQDYLEVFGSLVLIVYAFFLFRNNPSRSLKAPSEPVIGTWRDLGTGFLFTFSNPLILFLILALFTRFNFMDSSYRFYHYILGYLSIFGGAILWWSVITFFVNKVRAHFNMRSLWLINRVIAVLMFVVSMFGCIHGANNLLKIF